MRVKGIDSIRFICAFFVIIAHFGILNFPESNIGYKIANGLLNNLFPGQPAVMIFFIISGFCIHIPYTSDKKISVLKFYLKRVIRIFIPAVILYSFSLYVYGKEMGLIWSLICEIVYYFLYPIILYYTRKGKLNYVFILSLILSLGVSIFYSISNDDYNSNFQRSGHYLTWLVGLPVWILGVYAAEYYSKNKTMNVTFSKLILLRLSLLALTIIASTLRFHYLNIPYPFSLIPISFFGYYWFIHELDYYNYKQGKTISILEFSGVFSYSIYLMHFPILLLLTVTFDIYNTANFFIWAGCILAALISSYLYYLAVEKPSHILAQKI